MSKNKLRTHVSENPKIAFEGEHFIIIKYNFKSE